jgi:uncharacterized protein YutE (UPF0331/DUF86 family)
MTDEDLIAKKLAFIQTCLRELRQLARPNDLWTDIKEQRFVEHTLQLTIQAALDVASHIVSEERLGEPATNRDLFDRLARAGWLARDLADRVSNMAGFRNILVHGYADVDLAIVQDVLANHLGDLDAYIAAINARLGQSREG